MARVVIFEDNPLTALDLQEAVEAAGSTVCGTFADSQCAQAIAEEVRPDFAIIDLTLLDGATGCELATYLAESGCEIIVHSGDSGVHPVLSRIPHMFISKPFSRKDLTAVLRPSLGTAA